MSQPLPVKTVSTDCTGIVTEREKTKRMQLPFTSHFLNVASALVCEYIRAALY